MSKKPTVATVTLELTVVVGDVNLLDEIAEMALQGAVNQIPTDQPMGLGYTYNYSAKKSRRGMTVTPRGRK